jgi:hypothetical protein
MFRNLFIACCLVFLIGQGCKQDRFTPNANIDLRFETDTLWFDTVFTSVGSITKRFKVFNPTNRNILLDEVYLGGRRNGGLSAFRININGIPSNDLKGVELRANDSIYIFVEATIDPNSTLTPFIVSDSVVFRSGNRTGQVQLAAFGQNAFFIGNEVVSCDTTWTDVIPIVVYRSILVDSLCRLNIQPGTRIFFAKNATLFVLGSLQVHGTPENPVRFRGDRLDPFYRDLAGAWNGIHFLVGSVNNRITGAEFRNGNVAIRVDSLPVSGTAPNLRLNQVFIDNFAIVGLLGFTAHIEADNTLISNCGLYNFLGDFGGTYSFRHVTMANYSIGFSRGQPLFALSSRDLNGQANPTTLRLNNSIIWGTRQEEFLLDSSGSAPLHAFLSHNIIRTPRTQLPGNQLIFALPNFVSPGEGNFAIDTLSPAFRAGEHLIPQFPQLATDLDGKIRQNPPTLGAIERIE